MAPWLLAIGLAFTLFQALPALAQEVEPTPTGRLQFGPLSLTPAVVVVFGRDTNAIRTSTGEAASEIYGVPQLETWLGRGRTKFNLASAWEFSRQTTKEGSRQPTMNQYYVSRLEATGGRVGFLGAASFRDHYAPPTDFEGFERGLKSRRIERDLAGTVRVRPGGRISFRGIGRAAQLRYDADERFAGVSLEQNLNRNITSYGGTHRSPSRRCPAWAYR